MIKLMHGDCLELMAQIPDGSVDMILCDPPYGTMKGAPIDGWVAKDDDIQWDDALNPPALFTEYNRVLRMNGAIILFSQEPYSFLLLSNAHGNLPFSYRMIWKKNHFANALVAKAAPVSYYEDIMVFFKKYDTQGLHPLREYSKMVLKHCGGSSKSIQKRLGDQSTDHFFRTESTQFSLCTEEAYLRLCDAYQLHVETWFRPYHELVEDNERFKRRFKRRFNLQDGKKIMSNVLEFPKDGSGLHPTQKPVALCEHLIRTYTNEGETVLDNTMGSGTTGVACVNTGRSFIGIERDDKYFAIAQQRIQPVSFL